MPLRERWRWPAASFLIAVFGVAGAANAGAASPDKTPPAYRPEASNLKANPRAGTDSGSCGDSDRNANSNAEPTGVESSPRSGEDTDSAQPLPLEPPESTRGKMSGESSAFSIARLKQSFFLDQKAIWTSPLHLPSEDNSRLAPWGIGTLFLVAADKPIMRHLGSTPMAHSSSLSTFGVAALAGGGAAFFLLGSATNDPHSRETGFLTGEAAVDSIVAAEAMKFTFQRPRPNAVNAGRFGAGGASFPSEHAFVAWSMASVIAQEYPGPLTKLLVYGAASGISDVLDILKAIATGSIAFLLLLRYGMGVKAFPLSVYALEALLSFTLLSFTLLSGIRIFSRMLVETVRRDSDSKRLLLVGAGRAAQMIIRETQELESGYQVIGCVDDNPLKAGLRVLGVPVFGPVADLVEVVAEQRIDEVLIAIPSATPNEMRRVVALCK